MRMFKLITKVVLLIFLLAGCDSNRFDVDLSASDVNLSVGRLDQEFFHADINNIKSVNEELKSKYGSFYKIYIQQVLRLGLVDDPAISYSLKSFLEDKYVKELSVEVDKKYPSFDKQQKELSNAFAYYKYHFPNKVIPEVVTAISGFSANVIVTDSVLGVGLDLYLGADHEFYGKAGIPSYKLSHMTPDNIVYDAMRGWLTSEFESKGMKKDLLSNMIKMGRVLYLMDAMFPKAADHWKIGFEASEIEWCKESEYAIWSNIIDSEMLYSANEAEIRRYIGEAPFTAGMPKESPGRVGFWVGWQIVRQYMNEFPETTLEELMTLENAQLILQRSKYKPGN